MSTIKTNHQWREIQTGYDVPDKIWADRFEWADRSDSVVQFKGHWYHLSEFIRADKIFPGWHGAAPDSFFSGVLIRFSEDVERCIIGTYIKTSDV